MKFRRIYKLQEKATFSPTPFSWITICTSKDYKEKVIFTFRTLFDTITSWTTKEG